MKNLRLSPSLILLTSLAHAGTPITLGPTTFPCPTEFRTIDASGNNITNPLWGTPNTPLLRLAPNDYTDSISTPAGTTRPSPRTISNSLCPATTSLLNTLEVTDYLWQWGQFLDHDLSFTPTHSPAENLPIAVPAGDPHFDPSATGTATIPLSRSIYTTATSTREQLNEITAFIDGSQIYGSDTTRANTLRTLDGTGKLHTSPGNLLPFNTTGLPNDPSATDPSLFLAGDLRCNEQNGLIALHTLFLREHNHRASQLALDHPTLTGEQLYQLARLIVIAELQSITYREFLPLLLGPNPLPTYPGYDPTLNPSIANEFSTAAFRFGHSMLSSQLLRLDASCLPIPAGHLNLANSFFNPAETSTHGIEPSLRGLATQTAQSPDSQLIDEVRNFLFGPPGSGGLDLASLNIQRGRDHGLASYNDTRTALGLPSIPTFASFPANPTTQSQLAATYSSPADTDLWAAGLAEEKIPGGLVGPTFQAILTDQFSRTRNADRFFYLNTLPPTAIDFIHTQTLATIIQRNTTITTEFPQSAFHPDPLPLTITDFSKNPTTGNVLIDWNSTPGKTYTLLTSPDLQSWTTQPTPMPSQGMTTTHSLTSPNPRHFYRIQED